MGSFTHHFWFDSVKAATRDSNNILRRPDVNFDSDLLIISSKSQTFWALPAWIVPIVTKKIEMVLFGKIN
jgi:hypothetical protein